MQCNLGFVKILTGDSNLGKSVQLKSLKQCITTHV